MCGDFNVNFLDSSPRVSTVESVHFSFGLVCVVKFPTRNVKELHTLIDYIFLDINRFSTTTHSITNGMSDHDAQLVAISNLALSCIKHVPQCRRIIDEYWICTWGVQVLRSPNFFSREWRRIET